MRGIYARLLKRGSAATHGATYWRPCHPRQRCAQMLPPPDLATTGFAGSHQTDAQKMPTYHKDFSANGRTKNVYNKDFPGLTPGVRLEPQSRSDAGTQSEKTAGRTTSQKIFPRPSDWKTIRKFFLSRPAPGVCLFGFTKQASAAITHTQRQTLAAIFPLPMNFSALFLTCLLLVCYSQPQGKHDTITCRTPFQSRDSRFLGTLQPQRDQRHRAARYFFPFPLACSIRTCSCDPRQTPHQTHHQQHRTPLHTDDLLLVCFLTCRRAGVA